MKISYKLCFDIELVDALVPAAIPPDRVAPKLVLQHVRSERCVKAEL